MTDAGKLCVFVTHQHGFATKCCNAAHPGSALCRMHGGGQTRTLAEHLAEVEADLAAFKRQHAEHVHSPTTGRVLRGGEPAQVLTPAEQEAKCWAVINEWLAECPGAREAAACGTETDYWIHLRRVPGRLNYTTRNAGKRRARLDALAHAAQWCESEMQK